MSVMATAHVCRRLATCWGCKEAIHSGEKALVTTFKTADGHYFRHLWHLERQGESGTVCCWVESQIHWLETNPRPVQGNNRRGRVLLPLTDEQKRERNKLLTTRKYLERRRQLAGSTHATKYIDSRLQEISSKLMTLGGLPGQSAMAIAAWGAAALPELLPQQTDVMETQELTEEELEELEELEACDDDETGHTETAD